MPPKFWFWGVLIPLLLLAAPHPAWAQRVGENPTRSATDAFGTQIGNESIGLYSADDARGFSPAQAGNQRIEGLYFDQQTFLGPRVSRSTTIRIGLAAQSYPFPAPTGIADIALRFPGKTAITSVILQYDLPVGMRVAAADVQTPLVADRLGVTAGVGTFQQISDYHGTAMVWNTGALFQWTPNDTTEVSPFFFYAENHDREVEPLLYPGGTFVPPRYGRGVFFGQKWADRETRDLTVGVLARTTPWANWSFRAGLFRSAAVIPESHLVFFSNIQPDGRANLDILKYPRHRAQSYSGEVRATGLFTDGAWRHTVHVAIRGRATDRVYGGGATVAFGPSVIGVFRPVAEPAFALLVQDQDKVGQATPGLAYIGQWADVGEFSLGLQKSFYHRTVGKLGLPGSVATHAEPWLYNGTLAIHATQGLSVYGSYTRGLEEFGTAPEDAANRGAPLPARGTKQIDAGLRYRIGPDLSLVAGVFKVSKPYFDRGPANVYTDVGALTHRGVEISLTGQPFEGVRIVGGALFLKARVTGLPVDQGQIGKVPPGIAPRTFLMNIEYGAPSWRGFTVDGELFVDSSRTANRANTMRVPALAILTLGFRYPFAVRSGKASLRVQMENVTNTYKWGVAGSSGRFFPTDARSLKARLVADF